MIYAVVDTNVLVAAAKSHKPESSASRIINLVLTGVITPLICDEIIEEYEGILNLPVLSIPQDVSSIILDKFIERGVNPGRTPSQEEHPDPTDQVFYEISLSVEDAYLVTNNKKHFPQKPLVVTPSEMLLLLTATGVIK